MAMLKVIKDEDPALRKKSREITDITPRIKRLVGDMTETLHEYDGCGLAAPQIGVLRRLVLVETEPDKLYVLINPVITEREGKQNEVEGCLSLPGKWGVTDRPAKVTVRALDIDGNTFEVTGEGLLARALCHEIDHLDGVLFTDNALRMLTDEELEELRSND